MTPNPVDWTQDATIDPEMEYRALLRSLRRTRGFGLFFVQCSPAEGERLVQKIRADLPQKTIEVLKLDRAISNLYDEIAQLHNKDQIEILFIQGLELSLYEYEQEKLWNDAEERYSYSEGSVPKLLAHLNLSRERFRDHFKLCLVFLVPLFALKYLMRRAPDFFDWRSGVLELLSSPQSLTQDVSHTLLRDWADYFEMSIKDKETEVLQIQALIEESEELGTRARLLTQQSFLLTSLQRYESALESCSKAIELSPTYADAWDSKGLVLRRLGLYEEAIRSCDQAIKLQPNHYWAWQDRGQSLAALGNYEEAIASYDKAIAIKPSHYWAWDDRGNALAAIGRYEESLESHEKAIEIEPNYYWAWLNRGASLSDLGRYEEALDSCDKAISIQPDFYRAWCNRGNALFHLGRYKDAIASYDQALRINPNDSKNWYNKACFYALWGKVDEALENLQRAIELDSNCREYAKIDSDFDGIRQDERFRVLFEEAL